MSRTYEIMATGERPKDPGPPKKPALVPSLELDSRSSVRVRWKAPQLDLAAFDPPIEGYWVAWRPGGNRNLGWKEKKFVTEDAATVYDLVPQPGGGTRARQRRRERCTGRRPRAGIYASRVALPVWLCRRPLTRGAPSRLASRSW